MVVLLDNIRSLHNVGSIFRTADGVGVEKLYLCGITPSPLDRFCTVRKEVAKVALGAEEVIPWEKAEETSAVIDVLKADDFQIIALEQSPRAVPYYTVSLSKAQLKKTALILGAEVEGISAAILKKSDTIIEIPMAGNKESLNVSVAFGIAAFRLRDNIEK